MSAPIANGWPSKAEFTQQVLVAGQVSIRMKFAKAFSSLRISPDTLTLDRTGLLAHLSLVLCDPLADSLQNLAHMLM